MRNDEFVAPVNHSTSSALGSTTTGAATGALKGGLKGAIGAWSTVALIGAGIGLFIGLLTTGIVTLPAAGTLALTGSGLGKAAWIAFTTLGIGAVAATTIGPWAAGWGGLFGGTYGGAKGASRASDQVAMERGAAANLQAQVQAYKYQAQAVAQANGGRLVEPNSRYNQAPSSIQLDGANLEGRLAGAELAAAR